MISGNALELPYLGPWSRLKEMGRGVGVVLSVARNCKARFEAFKKLSHLDARIVTLVSPNSRNFGFIEDSGVLVLANSNIGYGAHVGLGTVIHRDALIGHDAKIGKFCFIGAGCRVLGGAVVDDFAYLGTNSVILPKKRVGFQSSVGALSVPYQDTPPGSIMVGNPARVLSSVKADISLLREISKWHHTSSL
jgi:acetyltransferase-like isoleucine patch superfamily enzyme